MLKTLKTNRLPYNMTWEFSDARLENLRFDFLERAQQEVNVVEQKADNFEQNAFINGEWIRAQHHKIEFCFNAVYSMRNTYNEYAGKACFPELTKVYVSIELWVETKKNIANEETHTIKGAHARVNHALDNKSSAEEACNWLLSEMKNMKFA